MAGSAHLNASDRLHFFQASACGRDMSRDSEFVKNRPKTTRKTPSAGKSTCISVPILRCFAGGQTLALVAMGRPIRGFYRGRGGLLEDFPDFWKKSVGAAAPRSRYAAAPDLMPLGFGSKGLGPGGSRETAGYCSWEAEAAICKAVRSSAQWIVARSSTSSSHASSSSSSVAAGSRTTSRFAPKSRIGCRL